jgi:predicted alpha/beta superfamily hydrolase
MKFITFLILTFLTIQAFAQVAETQTEKPFVLGVIREINSAELAEKRILNIYLPEGYEKDSSAKYPVIYLLDGSADEDFIHVAGLVQFNNFSWIDRVPKSIVVGIATVDRRRDFTFPTMIKEDREKYPTTGHSDKFIAFLEKELQPFVEKNYRANASKMIIGQSLGGLLATEILFKKPALFDKYVIISPSLWWDNGSLLGANPAIAQETFSRKTDIYIGVGKEGLTPTKLPRVMEVDANLLAEKLRQAKNPNVTVNFDYLPQEDHATISHQAVFNAFRMLYPAKTQKY